MMEDKRSPLISSYVLHSIDSDSLILDLYITIPNNNFVFIKQVNNFVANIDISINMKNITNSEQVKHISWTMQVIEDYYDDTKTDKVININKRFYMFPGEYEIFLNVRDNDSKNNWTLNKKINIQEFEGLSDIITRSDYNKENIFNLKNDIKDIDTLFCDFQFILPKGNNIIDELDDTIVVYVKLISESNYNIDILEKNIVQKNRTDSIYTLSIPINKYWEKNSILYFEALNYKKELKLINNNIGLNNYLSNPNQTLEIMAYYLPIENYKELKKYSQAEKIKYINNFWFERDPTPNTEENELRNEFNSRVKYSNKLFTNLGPGWRTDRGKIYINYGVPNFIEEKEQNNKGVSYIIWHYPSGKQFIFIDENGFNNYRLFREIN